MRATQCLKKSRQQTTSKMNKRLFTLFTLTVLLLTACKQNENPLVNKTVSDRGTDHTPGMVLEGMFRYMADAAIFRDCRSGKEFPVAMESNYIDLERAYLEIRGKPGSEVMVRLRGRYLERPAMEGDNKEVQLIIDQVEEIRPGESCEPVHHASLTDTYWKLLELDSDPVTTPEGMREAHVILASAESRAHGFAGCNNFFGGYQTEAQLLTFSAMGATRMACPEGMDTEQAFLSALGKTTRFTISGQFLQLYANDHLLARLEAIYL
jgi:copper homeostasis protein (lipoprotein)